METINLQSVRIALNRDEMEEMVGGSSSGSVWSNCFSHVSGTTAGIIGAVISNFGGPVGLAGYYSGIALGCYMRT